MAKISRLETIVNEQKALLLSLDMANNGWSYLNQSNNIRSLNGILQDLYYQEFRES